LTFCSKYRNGQSGKKKFIELLFSSLSCITWSYLQHFHCFEFMAVKYRNGRKLFKIKTLSSYVNILNLFLSIVFVRLSCVQPHEIITTQSLYAGKGSYFRVINLFQQHNTECRLRRYIVQSLRRSSKHL